MKRFVWGVLSAALVAGCSQDPFPKTGSLQEGPPPEPRPVVPPFVLDVPDSIEFLEGEAKQIRLRAEVPAPGKVEVKAFDLPEGVVFDAATLTLSWTPGYQTANDPKNPSTLVRSYPVRFVLRSTEDKLTTVEETSAFIVRDVARKFALSTVPANIEFTEGKTGSFVLKIESEDYPEGPFAVRSDNLPLGATITPVTGRGNEFQVRYNPPPSAVTYWDSFSTGGYYKKLPVSFTVHSPLGQSQSEELSWVLRDVRLKPKGSGPTSLTQGLDVNFTFLAQDLNGESAPYLSISPKPPFGNLAYSSVDLEPINGERGPAHGAISVRWNSIPVDKLGTSYTLNVSACVYRTSSARDLCTIFPVVVNFSGTAFEGPKIDRTNYPLGSIKYILNGKEVRIPMKITDPTATGVIPKVTIEPAAMASEVSWTGSELVIKPASEGFRQFNVVAKSSLAVNRTESFVFEALPWSWSPILVLTELPKAGEALGTAAAFENVQLANPTEHDLNGRISALRSTLVLTTSALAMKAELPAIESLAARVKNLILLSPLLENVTKQVFDEYMTLGLGFVGRLSSLPKPSAPLSSIEVTPKAGMTTPTKPVALAGTATAESSDPLMLKRTAGRCNEVLSLTAKAPALDEAVALKCTRANGGVLLISGIEWADFQVVSGDAKIAKNWMEGLVKP